MPIKSSTKQKVPYGRKKNMVHIVHKGGFFNIEDLAKKAVTQVSKDIINPTIRTFTKQMVTHKFGKKQAEAIDKAMKRQLDENPTLALKKLTDKDFWNDAFKTTHEFLKNDATMKRWKEPIGDVLSLIPVVGDVMEQGWKQLTEEDGKETDLKEDLNKVVRKIQAEEKLFKKYGIPTPPIAIGFASAEGYKKAIDDYRTKYKKELLKMKADAVLKKIKSGEGVLDKLSGKEYRERKKKEGAENINVMLKERKRKERENLYNLPADEGLNIIFGIKKKGKGLKRSGEGLRRAGSGTKRAGEGTKRAGEGLVRAGSGAYGQKGLGEELKEEMMKKYCK